MADRTVAELNNLYVDNATGDISPADLRDLVASVSPPYATMSRLVASATSIGAAGTYVKAAGTTTLNRGVQFDMPVDGRLRYTGSTDRHFHVAVSVAMTSAGTNDIIGLKVAKNGVVMDESITRRFVGTGTDVGSTALHADAMMAQNDYLELYVTNESDTASVTIEELYFFALGMLI